MRFICEKSVILKEISIAQEIISSRNALSILSNVLIEADNNTLIIKATDLKVGFETRIPVEVETPGTTTIFCDKFLGILRSLPEGEVIFDHTENGRLIITPLEKKIDFQLKSIPSDKFPEIQEIPDDNYFEIPQEFLNQMVQQTIFAISDDETRYFMNGVYMEKQENKLVMVATDGRRLSYIEKEIETPLPDFAGIIIPPKILTLIKKLSSGEGSIEIAINDKTIYTRFDNLKISSTLIEGQFPNYSRVIPEYQEHNVLVQKSVLNDALKRVSLLAEQKSRRIYLTVGQGIMTLSSEESEIGHAKEEIPCEYEGQEYTIALNYVYLQDPLKVVNSEGLIFQFTEPSRAVTIRSNPESEYFHIVMPMQMD
ncbi:DNA polymerase III subunit beta [Spirochaeta cellobiosiphila]|uniref:DNA polymerase III subunit beta n=1 Tax=Spirochaeta cellobiosiphila TaxID=504483 RepID=UPI0004255C6B|nr:DNA polymerase III subunit beta [Spirochaeta cellobiosiphila]